MSTETQPAERTDDQKITNEIKSQLFKVCVYFGAANVIAVVLFWVAAVNFAKDQLIASVRNEDTFKQLLKDETELWSQDRNLHAEYQRLSDSLAALKKDTPQDLERMRLLATQLGEQDVKDRLAQLVDAQSRINGITLLPVSQLQNFVQHKNPNPDPRIANMTRDGAGYVCQNVPSGARGAIISVMIGGRQSSAFVCADSDGHLGEDHTVANALNNYNASWAGGLLLCPFVKGTHEIRFRLDTNEARPDFNFGCIATVVGWY
jgi:hypothetical protein